MESDLNFDAIRNWTAAGVAANATGGVRVDKVTHLASIGIPKEAWFQVWLPDGSVYQVVMYKSREA